MNLAAGAEIVTIYALLSETATLKQIHVVFNTNLY